MAKTPATKKNVVTLTHEEASRKNIPTAEYQSVMRTDEQSPIRVAYERRNRDLDPQLVWRGKDEQDWSDLVVPAPPLYIQEKVHPKVLIDDLKRQTEAGTDKSVPQFDLFADFNGLPSEDAKTEFYQHDAHWSNRMILGDSLQVMASLAEREGLRGKVQCIYLDPPYGIQFDSNFQWSTTSRDVKDGNLDHITREPEQVKAFRDTWRDGIHSYLSYLRDRLGVARDLLADSGSIFVQIGDQNVHRVRALMDEVFGDANFVESISYRTKNMTLGGRFLEGICDTILWYARDIDKLKYRRLFKPSEVEGDSHWNQVMEMSGHYRKLTGPEIEDHSKIGEGERLYQLYPLYPTGSFATGVFTFDFQGQSYDPPSGRSWKSPIHGMQRLNNASRIEAYQNGKTLRYRLFFDDYAVSPLHNIWLDTAPAADKTYVVQTGSRAIARCILMASDPGDLVLDPTCGSGTTAFVAEQWGRRWITVDTSRVALALARARVMGARYPFYLLADSRDGQVKEGRVAGRIPSDAPTKGNIRQGFVYERVPHITLKSIAHNSEIDVIWQDYQERLEPLRIQLNLSLKTQWQEWDIPRDPDAAWPNAAKEIHAAWWDQRIARQRAIDASISAKADFEYLYDKPYEDNKKVRVAGPFTVESLSPHRVLAVDENDEFIEETPDIDGDARNADNFVQVILDNLYISGVQQADKGNKLVFSSISPWPGERVCAEGRYLDADEKEKRAAIFVGPEFGTVSRPDLVSAAREAGDAAFDVLIACAFNYDAHSSEFNKLGRIPVLKARMNADLHMAADLKNTGKGNLFVIFGEPDIKILDEKSGEIRVKVNGVDVFHPSTGEVRSDGADGIACWFVDTDYNEESFFVRQAYFLGANDPYKALKTTLKAEINEEAWSTLHSDTSRPFPKPVSGRIAVKVINHLGDEVMKVFKVS
jgi:adenine-specific DNA-methyltransferase